MPGLAASAKGRRFEVNTEGAVEAGVRRVLARVPPANVAAAKQLLGALALELEPGS